MTETEARNQRDDLLYSSDWTQAADAPLTGNEITRWRVYRQALRDVTLQIGFPEAVEWPVMPARDPVVESAGMMPGGVP
jgi:hypothetical protein